MPPSRRFPPPWSIEELNDACFVVRDANGQQLAYVYFEEEPGRRSAAKLLTKDEARAYFAARDFSISSYSDIRGAQSDRENLWHLQSLLQVAPPR